MFDIQEELKKLPDQPGVYLMRDERDAILYIGKALSLKNRVRQYFQSGRDRGPKIESMVARITRFEYILTDSEMEALVLECNLIKENRPKYNTLLTDDKTYPYIKVTLGEVYPRVLFSRRMKKDKSRYYGPYTSAGAVRDTIELVRKLYGLRSCGRVLSGDIAGDRPCLYHHIHQCAAPCQGEISPEAYRERVDNALGFLNGKISPVIRELEEKMRTASAALDFERAAEYRDLLGSVKQIAQRQKITDSDGEDRDVIALSADDGDAVVQVFFVREGKLIGREHFHVTVGAGDGPREVMSAFVRQYYAGTPFIPGEVMLQMEIDDAEAVSHWLSARRGKKSHIRVPQKGRREKLVELAARNAKLVLSRDKEKIRREEGRTVGAVKEVAALLGLACAQRMEAYDISNTNGFEPVGSMIVYENGRPHRSDYRRFRLRTVEGPDDYGSMREVLMRRFKHGMEERESDKGMGPGEEYGSFSRFPDLILMDGGKAQVGAALRVLGELGLDIPVCGMVKDDRHRTRGLYYRDGEVPTDTRSEGFSLITRIQDEAHRFAVEYHRSLRGKSQVHSVLDDIPFIGPGRRKALMRQYQSIEAIREASVESLMEVPSMDRRSAVSVRNFFRPGVIGQEEVRPAHDCPTPVRTKKEG